MGNKICNLECQMRKSRHREINFFFSPVITQNSKENPNVWNASQKPWSQDQPLFYFLRCALTEWDAAGNEDASQEALGLCNVTGARSCLWQWPQKAQHLEALSGLGFLPAPTEASWSTCFLVPALVPGLLTYSCGKGNIPFPPHLTWEYGRAPLEVTSSLYDLGNC